MSSAVAIVLIAALICTALALLLWQRAEDTRNRTMTDRFVGRRVTAAHGSAPAESATRGDAAHVQRPRVDAPSTMLSRSPPHGVREYLRDRRDRMMHASSNLMRRAGIANSRALLLSVGTLILAVAMAIGARTHWLVGVGFIVFGALCLYAALSWRAQKRYQRITRQLPVFLDGIVRLIIIGNSVPAAFQAALATTDAPLRECLDRVSRMLRSGVEIDAALKHVSQMYRISELELIGSVLRISVRYGGRSDVMLDRMAGLMRDMEQAERELIALTTETRLSSWMLGLLPVLVGGFVTISNPRYFAAMWADPLGQRLVFVAAGLQALGVFLLYSLARLKD
ncbi:type II secretion system F family protein [Caballeronia sp. DA-9]|uniref:type II secretion system F family protein n=1 Tax=Caballeronia sp. DA-9 TaxID=3436237 RepID=UPI003F665753